MSIQKKLILWRLIVNKFMEYMYSGDWVFGVTMGIVLLALVALVAKEPKPEPPPKVQEITLENGTKCVVLKGVYSDNAITCEWGK